MKRYSMPTDIQHIPEELSEMVTQYSQGKLLAELIENESFSTCGLLAISTHTIYTGTCPEDYEAFNTETLVLNLMTEEIYLFPDDGCLVETDDYTTIDQVIFNGDIYNLVYGEIEKTVDGELTLHVKRSWLPN